MKILNISRSSVRPFSESINCLRFAFLWGEFLGLSVYWIDYIKIWQHSGLARSVCRHLAHVYYGFLTTGKGIKLLFRTFS